MREYIIMIASIVTALTVISTTCFKVYIFFRNLEKKYDEMQDAINQNNIHILKLAITNENLPLIERIHSGEEYIKLGGNGAVKKIYNHLLEEFAKEENI